MSSIYSYFDEIVCITLDTTESRRKHAEGWFKKLGIPAKFFVAKKHPKGGIYGCFDSHIKILIDAYKRGLDNVLVFEDDVMATDSYSEELVQKAIDFMKSNSDWDVFYFGYCHVNPHNRQCILNVESINENIVQYNPLLSSALCYNKTAIKKILTNYKEYIGNFHYDHYISIFANLNNYCIVPMIMQQNLYLEYNIEAANLYDIIIRFLYPVIIYIKYEYRWSVIKYYLNILYYKYKEYDILFYITTLFISILIFSVLIHNTI